MDNVINIYGGEKNVDFDARIQEVAKAYFEVFIEMADAKYPNGATDEQYNQLYVEFAMKFGMAIGGAIDDLKGQ